jgi:peptidylprolyl isomerase
MTTNVLTTQSGGNQACVRRPSRRPSLFTTAAIAGLLIASIGAAPAQTPQAPAAARPAQPPRPKAAAPTPAVAARPAAAPSAAAPRGDGDIVARVAGRDISIAEVRSFVSGLAAEQQAALARDPALLSQTLRLMLANQLVLKEAVEKKWQDQPAVAVQLARIRENAIVETYLQTASKPPENYPDDAEIQKAYDANKSAFIVPRQFRIAQIFVALPDGADKATEDQARKKLLDLQTKLKQPKADFAAIAKESSDQPESAARGGELGWLAETQIRPEIKTQVMGLANNAIGDPVKLDGGWHIIKLIETKPAATRPLTEVRVLLVERLRAQRAEALRRNYLARLLEQTPPAINELALIKVFDPATTATPGH